MYSETLGGKDPDVIFPVISVGFPIRAAGIPT
jgi:hypothetical protein